MKIFGDKQNPHVEGADQLGDHVHAGAARDDAHGRLPPEVHRGHEEHAESR